MHRNISKSQAGVSVIRLDDHEAHYYTSDLGCAASLILLGYRLVTVDKANTRKAVFVIQRKDGMEQDANDYYADRLKVRARGLFDGLKALKNMLYSS